MTKPEFKQLPIDKLQRGYYQPRRYFEPALLTELAESIKANGIVQPIVVRPRHGQDNFEIIAGERRWRAAQLAGLEFVPCLINYYTDGQAAAVTTVENINRVDLNPIEEAQAYQRLIDEFNYLHEEVAAIVGKHRTKITNSLRLLNLDVTLQNYLIDGSLTEGHGKILASLSQPLQLELGYKCINQNWSVRKLEQAVRDFIKQTPAFSKQIKDSNVMQFERMISEKLGTEVLFEMDGTKKGGWIKFRYYDMSTLEGLLEKIGIQTESD